MEATATRIDEPVSYTVTDRRYIDGQWMDCKRTATVTHELENYRDQWTGEMVDLGYNLTIEDHLEYSITYATISDADLTKYWINKAS